MNILGWTLARRSKPELAEKSLSLVGVTGSRGWWSGFLHEITSGGWQRNEIVRPETVLANPTLYACITLIARDVAKLCVELYEEDANGIWIEAEDSPAFSPFLRKPNHYQTWVDFIEWWMVSKLAHGNTFVLKMRDARNVVTAGYILDPCRVMPLVAPDGSVFYQLYTDPLNQAESVTVPAREIMHDTECPLFHPLCGVSPIYAAGWPALQGLHIRDQSDKFFANGSRPGGLLLVPGHINQTAADQLKADWETNHAGDNVGKLAVLTGGMTYQAMAATAEQSQLIDQLRMTDEDIARCFHIPRYKVGIGPDPTISSVEALNQQYYSDCLQNHIVNLQAVVGEGIGLPNVPGRDLMVKLKLDDLFQMDTATRIKVAQDAISGGASPNEARKRWLDLGPVDGGETPYLQEQNWPIKLLADRELPSQRPPTPPAPMPDPNPPVDAAAVVKAAIIQWETKAEERGYAA
jgi:HK97 family phage portal protein